MSVLVNFLKDTGFYLLSDNWLNLVMIVISLVLAYLAIVKKFEPMLLLPIAFGMMLTNLPGADMFHEILFAGGHVHWELFGGGEVTVEFLDSLKAANVSADILNPYYMAIEDAQSVAITEFLT